MPLLCLQWFISCLVRELCHVTAVPPLLNGSISRVDLTCTIQDHPRVDRLQLYYRQTLLKARSINQTQHLNEDYHKSSSDVVVPPPPEEEEDERDNHDVASMDTNVTTSTPREDLVQKALLSPQSSLSPPTHQPSLQDNESPC